MKRLLFQLGYTACVVSLGAALAVVLWTPAFSQGVKGDRLDAPIIVDPPTPLREGNEGTRTLPLMGICKMPLAMFADEPELVTLIGTLAQRYIDAAGIDVLPGADTVAYKMNGDTVAVLFAKQGCVVGLELMPEQRHSKIMSAVPVSKIGYKADRLDIQAPLPQAKPVQPTPAPPFRCGPLQEMRKVLKKRFGEQVSGRGLTNSSEAAALEIYTSKEGTWTILLTSADGIGCVIATGRYWSDVKHEIPGMDS